MAGESAQREYERRRAARQERVRRSWGWTIFFLVLAFAGGWLASIALMSAVRSIPDSLTAGEQTLRLHRPPTLLSVILGLALAMKVAVEALAPSHNEVAWRRGAVGERVVGRALDALAGDAVHVLHDRRIPGSRANIDHIAVTTSGAFTVDAKRYSGRLEVRGRGRELWIKGRNRSKLLDQALKQAATVRSVLHRAGLEDVPVTGVLCFVDTKMPLLFPPKQVGDVLLTTPRQLPRRLRANDQRVELSELPKIVEVLDAALRSYGDGPAPEDGPARPAGRRRGHPGSRSTTSSLEEPTTSAGPDTPVAPCERCGEAMIVRTRRSDGASFYGCAAFPRCRNTRPKTAAEP